MEKLQVLNSKPSVSKVWPEEVGQEVIEKLLTIALDDHHLEQKGVVIINGASASVVNSGSGFSWIKMEETNGEQTWRIDVLFPVKVSIVKLDHGKLSRTEKDSVYELPLKLTLDHPFSDWFNLKSVNHKVVVAKPILEKIFEVKGITGKEVYNYALETTYRTHKGLIPRTIFVQMIPKNDSLARMKKISDDQWDMTCYEALNAPRPFKFEKVMYSVIIFCSALSVLFIFIIVYTMSAH